MNYKVIIGILVCLLLIGSASASFTEYAYGTPTAISSGALNPIDPYGFDGDYATNWESLNLGGAPNPWWVQMDYGAGVTHAINRYNISVNPPNFARYPIAWQLKARNITTDDWVVLDSRAAQVYVENLSYSFTNTIPFRYYNFSITESSATAADVVEFRLLYETPVNRTSFSAYANQSGITASTGFDAGQYFYNGTTETPVSLAYSDYFAENTTYRYSIAKYTTPATVVAGTEIVNGDSLNLVEGTYTTAVGRLKSYKFSGGEYEFSFDNNNDGGSVTDFTGAIIATQDFSNHYRIVVGNDTAGSSNLSIWKNVAGTYTLVNVTGTNSTYTRDNKNWMKIKFDPNTNNMSVWLRDDVGSYTGSPVVIATQASAFDYGYFGFYANVATAGAGNLNVVFDDVTMKAETVVGYTNIPVSYGNGYKPMLRGSQLGEYYNGAATVQATRFTDDFNWDTSGEYTSVGTTTNTVDTTNGHINIATTAASSGIQIKNTYTTLTSINFDYYLLTKTDGYLLLYFPVGGYKYRLMLDAGGDAVTVRKYDAGGASSIIGTYAVTIDPNTWYSCFMEYSDSKIKVFFNGRDAVDLTATDLTSAYPYNTVDFLFYGEVPAYNDRLRNLQINALDTTSPSGISASLGGVPHGAMYYTNNTAAIYGADPLTVQFSDVSKYYDPMNPVTSRDWTYQGTSATNNTKTTFATTESPLVTFGAGNFSIKLNDVSIGGTDTSPQTFWVNVSAKPTVADFVGAPLTSYAVTDVSFVDFTTGSELLTWTWDFGDTGTSIVRNPTHTYTTPGIYTVALTVTSTNGTSTETKVDYVTMGIAPDPDTASKLSFQSGSPIIANLTGYTRTVQLSNSINASWINGTTLFDADHIRITTLTANTTTFAENTIPSYSINNATGTIMFNATNTSGFKAGTTPLSFMDVGMAYDRYSSGSTIPAWGTGSLGNSTFKVQFNVSSLVDSPLMYSWMTYSNFSVNNTGPIINEEPVLFIPDLNFTADNYHYDFGDGTTLTTTNLSATHMYTSTVGDADTGYGSLNVTLTASRSENASVTNTTTRSYLMTPVYNTSYVHADFSADPTSGTGGMLVKFTDLSVWGSTNAASGRTYNWSFGDGGYSSFVGSISHVYTDYGVFTVNLTVNNTLAIDYEEKTNYISVSTKQDVTNLVYQAQLYRFIFQNLLGTPLGGLSVTITPLNYTMPSEWTSTLIGISPSVNIKNNTISGITGSDGSLGTPLLTSLGYRVNITGTAHSGDIVDYSIVEYPPSQGTDILITLPTSVTGFIRVTPTPAFITYNIYNQTINSTSQTLSVNFNDPTSSANLTIVKVVNQSGYVLNTTTYLGTSANTIINNFTYIIGKTSPPGDILSYGFSSYVSTAGGWNNITETYDSNTGKSLTGNAVYDQWAAIIIIVLVSSAFTASTVYIGTIGVGLMGLFFYYTVKWFTPGVQGTVFITMCVFWICIGIIGFIAKKGRGGF